MSAPIIVIGEPAWRADVADVAAAVGHPIIEINQRDGYVPALVETHAAIILVDGADPDWAFWCSTPKASPAARRIPIVLITKDDALTEASTRHGADFTLPSRAIPMQLAELIQDAGRANPAAVVQALLTPCAEPLPETAREAITLFNAGQYYKQHDLLEAQWMQETRPIRDLYRAILQVGIAYYQVERGNQRGAIKMLLRSMQWLNILPDVCQGVDIATLRSDARAVLAALEVHTDADLSTFDMSLLRPVKLMDQSH